MSAPTPRTLVPAGLRQRAEQSSERFNAWWLQREPRERTLLKGGAALVVLALIWLLGVKPAMQSLDQSAQRLPQLQNNALRVDAVIREAQVLRRGQSGSIPAAELAPALQGSLQRAGLSQVATVNETEGIDGGARQWEIHFDNASAGRVIDWLAEVPLLLRMRTVSIDLSRTRIDGRDRPGSVTGGVVLAAQAEDAR